MPTAPAPSAPALRCPRCHAVVGHKGQAIVRCPSCGFPGQVPAPASTAPTTGRAWAPPGAPPAPHAVPRAAGEMAIESDGLTKRYGATAAVDAIALRVPRGGVVGFVGPNGAGKTTTIRMLLGLVQPTSGTATVLGHPITKPSAFLHRIGSLIEAPAFYPQLSGARNLHALAVLGGHDRSQIPELLARVGLADRGDDAYKSYSLGMKQRLGLAAALLPNPELLILDEPTNGLDPAGIHEIRDLLRALGREGRTVFVSSHLMGEMQKVCDRLVVLQRGRILFQGPVGELLAQQQAFTAVASDARHHARLVELAAKAGLRASVEGGRVVVLAAPSRAASFNQLAMQNGIVLAELTPRAADLEEEVLQMTGGQ